MEHGGALGHSSKGKTSITHTQDTQGLIIALTFIVPQSIVLVNVDVEDEEEYGRHYQIIHQMGFRKK